AAQARLAQTQRALSEQQALLEMQVEIAKIKIKRARTLNELAVDQLASTQLSAPFSGIVISIEKRPGDWIRAYEAIGAIADPSELWIVATVLEEDVDRIAVGQPATVRLDAYPNEEYLGNVLQVAREPIIWQGKRAYEVTVAFDDGQDVPATIRMGADVTVSGRSRENVLLIPSQAILTIGGREYVEVVGEDDNIERVEIQTGITNGTETEIVDGLQVGQEIRIP
ncbi:MAG: efflux RND transporter periplasmic adaptor subunit, partial [Anaerolineae bacterium]